MKTGAALARLVLVQACWTYERMQGIGLAYAMLPGLAVLLANEPARGRAALARASQFFNGNPYLGGVAVGALTRVELDGEPPEHVDRLRAALAGPLGAIGDQFFWAGTVPGAIALLLLWVALGRSPLAGLLVVVVGHLALRLLVGRWGLRIGWDHGARVGFALASSGFRRWAPGVGHAAAFLGGLALPVVAHWILRGRSLQDLAPVAVVLLAAALLRGRTGRISMPVVTALILLASIVWILGGP